MVVDVSRRKILLRLGRPRRQTRQFSVIQLAHRTRHLLGIDLRRLHRPLRFLARQKILNLLLVLLAGCGRLRDIILNISGRNNMVLRNHRLRCGYRDTAQQHTCTTQFAALKHFHLYLQLGDGLLSSYKHFE